MGKCKKDAIWRGLWPWSEDSDSSTKALLSSNLQFLLLNFSIINVNFPLYVRYDKSKSNVLSSSVKGLKDIILL